MDRLLKPAEVAALLRVHPTYVYRLARRGLLPCHRFGRATRFESADIEAFKAATRRGRLVQAVGGTATRQEPALLEDLALPAGFVPVTFDMAAPMNGAQRKTRAGR